MGWFEDTGAAIGIDPGVLAGTTPYVTPPGMNYPGGSPTFQERQSGDQLPPPPQTAAPQAGQWAATNQGFLDWATKNYGADANSFVKIPPGQLQAIAQRYTQETGNKADFQGGPSGDRIDFGQGTQDALTSSGQIWNNESTGAGGPGGSRPAPSAAPGAPGTMGTRGGWSPGAGPDGGGAPTGPLPGGPTVTPLDAPAPFQSTAPQLGAFQGPAPAAAPGQVSYQNATAPGQLTAQQLGAPERLSYTPSTTPTAFSGSRQATPGTLSYENLPTPANYQHENYQGLSAEQLQADPSYQFRLKQGQELLENSAASRGVARSGNTAKALIDYGQNAASQEYGAADARARATNASNNAGQLGAAQTNAQTGLAYNQNANSNAYQFGQANISNAERANADNYGRASTEAQQTFQNANQVEQQNNAGQMNAAAGNNAAQLGVTQANNASNLAYGTQNFQQGNLVNQQNNAGNAFATTTNNQANQAHQAQQFGQAAQSYGLNAGAQQQQYAQQLGAYQTNTGTALQYNQNTNQNALNAYNSATNAALGYGNLNLGYQNSANQYALGQGGLGIQQGNLDLSRQGQSYNQDLSTFLTNYQVNTTDPWNRNYQLAQLGAPTRPD